jgi:hypothetical protein
MRTVRVRCTTALAGSVIGNAEADERSAGGASTV